MSELPSRNTSTPTEDVATLMARVRERVAQRRASTSPNGKGAPASIREPDGPDDLGRALAAQADFNHAAASVLTTLEGVLDRLGEQVAAVENRMLHQTGRQEQDAARVRDLSERMREVVTGVDETTTRIDTIQKSVGAQLDDLRLSIETTSAETEARLGQGLELRLSHELDELRIRLSRAERIQRSLQETLDARLAAEQATEVQPVQTAAAAPVTELEETFDYLLFEHYFRGPVEEIKRRQQQYAPLFTGRVNVLDLGSGRGELVELLTEQGVGVTGIDISEDMVTFCRGRGLHVVHADFFAHLEGLPDGSVDGVASFQVVEHLTPEQILRLIALCGDKVRSGAPIVVETVNPICPLAMGNFYLDPSHVRPVPAQMLRFMFQRGPFAVESIRFSAPVPGSRRTAEVLEVTGELPREAGAYQDYAVIARRR